MIFLAFMTGYKEKPVKRPGVLNFFRRARLFFYGLLTVLFLIIGTIGGVIAIMAYISMPEKLRSSVDNVLAVVYGLVGLASGLIVGLGIIGIRQNPAFDQILARRALKAELE